MRRNLIGLLIAIALPAAAVAFFFARKPKPPPVVARIETIGPTIISNQTAYPLTIYGLDFHEGDVVTFSGPITFAAPATFIDSSHLALRLPPQAMPPALPTANLRVNVRRKDGTPLAGFANLTVVNDASYTDLTACALTPDGNSLFVASPNTDQLFKFDLQTGVRETVATGDRPVSLAISNDGSQLVVADNFGEQLEIFPLPKLNASRAIPLGEWPEGVTLDGPHAFVTTRQGALLDVDLGNGKIDRKALPGRQPRAIAHAGAHTWIAQLGTDDIVDAPQMTRIAPGPGVKIVGGRTAKYGDFVMGGKASRGLAYDPTHGLLFASTIGPNIGPNPDRVEVSMNGGITVIDAKSDQILLHRGLGSGVLEGLAIDPDKQRLYAADIAEGRVLAFDTGKLRDDPEHAQVGELFIAPPANTPRIRFAAELGINGRSTDALHSGPRALCLDAAHARLYAVNAFSSTVSAIDVGGDEMKITRTYEGPDAWVQRDRRLGEIIFDTDVGRSGMSCDACHLDGHTSGVLYEKTHPLRIYRVSTLRGIRDSAPYFTPSALPSLKVVAHDVLARNRFHNPDPSPDEIKLLAEYQALFAAPPNPNVDANGAPKRELVLPDGRKGNAIHGMELFEGKELGCSARLCHPRPTFSADQDQATRNHFDDVGTPVILPLHPEWQEQNWKGWPPPPLVGTWDVFPLLQSGAGGLSVRDGSVIPTNTFPQRAVLDMRGGRAHGGASTLSPQDEDDLLAYLLSI